MKQLFMIFLICFLSACAPTAEPLPETAVETVFIEVTATNPEISDPRVKIEHVEPAANGDCSQSCKLSIISSYFTTLDQIYQANSSQEDIEKLFTLFHEDVQYEHLDYGANFDKSAWKTAFTNNLQRGAYKNGENETIGILNVIHGKDHIAVEYAYGTENENGNWTQDGEGLLALFGFADGKIILVREYW